MLLTYFNWTKKDCNAEDNNKDYVQGKKLIKPDKANKYKQEHIEVSMHDKVTNYTI